MKYYLILLMFQVPPPAIEFLDHPACVRAQLNVEQALVRAGVPADLAKASVCVGKQA